MGGAACAHATTIVESTSFEETIVTGTDTFETANQSPISTLQYVAFGSEIPADIESDLVDQTWNNPGYAADFARIAASAPQAVLTTDLAFLTAQQPNVYIPSSGPTLVGQPANISDISGLYPGFSVVSYIATTIGTVSYSTGAFVSSNTIIDGTVTFDIYEVDYVEQESAAPEPVSILLSIPGLAIIFVAARRSRKEISR